MNKKIIIFDHLNLENNKINGKYFFCLTKDCNIKNKMSV